MPGLLFREAKAVCVTNFSKIRHFMEEKMGIPPLYQLILLPKHFSEVSLGISLFILCDIKEDGINF